MLSPCRKIIYAVVVGGRPGSKRKLVVIQNICVQWWDLGGVGVSVINLLKIDIKKKLFGIWKSSHGSDLCSHCTNLCRL